MSAIGSLVAATTMAFIGQPFSVADTMEERYRGLVRGREMEREGEGGNDGKGERRRRRWKGGEGEGRDGKGREDGKERM